MYFLFSGYESLYEGGQMLDICNCTHGLWRQEGKELKSTFCYTANLRAVCATFISVFKKIYSKPEGVKHITRKTTEPTNLGS